MMEVGPLFATASPSTDLQRKLTVELGRLLSDEGPPEYSLSWLETDMPWGGPIPQLQARVRGIPWTGWPTPTAHDNREWSVEALNQFIREGKVANRGVDLNAAAVFAGYPTPQAEGDAKQASEGKVKQGQTTKIGLDGAALLVGQPNMDAVKVEGRGALNPPLSAWLMGYEPRHLECAPERKMP